MFWSRCCLVLCQSCGDGPNCSYLAVKCCPAPAHAAVLSLFITVATALTRHTYSGESDDRHLAKTMQEASQSLGLSGSDREKQMTVLKTRTQGNRILAIVRQTCRANGWCNKLFVHCSYGANCRFHHFDMAELVKMSGLKLDDLREVRQRERSKEGFYMEDGKEQHVSVLPTEAEDEVGRKENVQVEEKLNEKADEKRTSSSPSGFVQLLLLRRHHPVLPLHRLLASLMVLVWVPSLMVLSLPPSSTIDVASPSVIATAAATATASAVGVGSRPRGEGW